MSSLIEGYNYDIFISYRQKDNKHDGWVTEFVDNLKGELESTFKEDISVYFDENPHDRLQETHNVDKSLEDKLKCLILIPIISQTYCDPKSYAWQSEFLPFLRMAEKDQFGIDVKLRGGNVANRILPIRIHDLEQEDINLYEKETGSVLRAIDFVFKTAAGVNRPLQPKDNKNDNLYKTLYRDQINKVAGAIKDIIQGLKAEPLAAIKSRNQQKESVKQTEVVEKSIARSKKAVSSLLKWIAGIVLIAVLIAAGIIFYPKIFKQDTLEKLRSSGEKISVAVMPFQNNTSDTLWNYWQNGIQDIIINYLSNSDELSVIQTESVNNLLDARNLTDYASITPSIAGNVSKKLGAKVLIYGSIIQAGKRVRFTVQLIDSKTKKVIEPFQIEGPGSEENVFNLIDSLSIEISNFLVISQLKEKEGSYFLQGISTNSPEAFREYISGTKALRQRDWRTASEFFLKAVKIDTNFVSAKLFLLWSYAGSGFLEEGKELFFDIYNKRDQVPKNSRWFLDEVNVYLTGTTEDLRNLAKQFVNDDNQNPILIHETGAIYRDLGQHSDAIDVYEKLLDLFKYWNVKPYWAYTYSDLGDSYVQTGQYKKARKLYKQAEKDFPDDNLLNYRQAVLFLILGNTVRANEYIEKYTTIRKQNGASEAAIALNLARIYVQTENLEKAEEYYRQALSLEPESPGRMNALAYFLINQDRNVVDGLELVERALESQPENYNFLHTKGWGLYKQGKYQEALEVLQRSWDLRMENDIYSYQPYLHLEEAKKAAAN